MTRKKKTKKRNLKKDHDVKQRLHNIEIDEISLVDKPAIEEEFIITKQMGKGKKTVKTKSISMAKEIQKGVFWKRAFKKDTKKTKHGEDCVFCGITKIKEGEKLGMGMRNGVCFKCAVANIEHGVVDDCIDGTFNIEDFKKKHPEVELYAKSDKGDEEDSEDGKSKDGKGNNEGKDESAVANKGKDGKPTEDEASEDESEEDDDEESEEDDDDEDDESEENDDEDDSTKKSMEKRVGKLEKQNADAAAMLAQSLEFHEQLAVAMNQQVELLMSTLELLLSPSENDTAVTVQAVKDIKEEIKSFRTAVQKAGAKISAGRLSTLRDIADKLTTLIQSVVGEQEKQRGGKTDGKKAKTKSAEVESLKSEVSGLKKSVSEKDEAVEKLANRLDEMEAFYGGTSTEIDDDDDDDDSSSDSNDKSTSVFKDFGPLSHTVARISKSTRISERRRRK